jgi:hypothetical protein
MLSPLLRTFPTFSWLGYFCSWFVCFVCCLLTEVVHQAGFEPATDGLEIRCSIQLSYWCVNLFNIALVSMTELKKASKANVVFMQTGDTLFIKNTSKITRNKY